jgi:thiol:disulfide interchange protein DsbD
MGLVSGFISAPCTGPVLLSLLAFIARGSANGQGVLFGASLLFTYALGMGTLFFAVALGASLFRPGRWMEHVKSVFGIGLLVMALWFLAPLSPALRSILVAPTWGLPLGAALALLGVALGGIHLSFHGPARERLRKALGVALTVLGLQAVLNNLLYVPTGTWQQVETVAELEEVLVRADERLVPVLIDFGASYCPPCLEMDRLTFHDPAIEPELERRFELIKIDLSVETPDKALIREAFASETLPSVLLYPSSSRLSEHMDALRAGEPMPSPALHLHEFTAAEEFAPLMSSVE